MKNVYFMNQPISFMFKAGLPFLSVDSWVDMFDRIKGRINATKRVADECMPSVPENASMVKPVMNPRVSNSHPGISKGKSIINRI